MLVMFKLFVLTTFAVWTIILVQLAFYFALNWYVQNMFDGCFPITFLKAALSCKVFFGMSLS